MRSSLLAVLLAVALLVPAAARAQSASPFAPRAETSGPVADADRDADGGDGLPGWAEALIIVAGIALIGGIGVAIVRDARSASGGERERVPDPRPGGEGLAGGAAATSATRRRTNARDRKRRKIARQSRKRNR